jgi:hypothetical protein
MLVCDKCSPSDKAHGITAVPTASNASEVSTVYGFKTPKLYFSSFCSRMGSHSVVMCAF